MVAARTQTPARLPRAPQAGSLGYRGFSRRLPVVLTGAGGALAIPGALGSWIRTSSVAETLSPAGSTAFAGAAVESGWILAVTGGVVVATGILWLRGTIGVQPLVVSSLLLASGAGWRIALLEARTEEMARGAASGAGVTYFQASFGWGAWLLLVAAVLAALGAVAAILHELDARSGLA